MTQNTKITGVVLITQAEFDNLQKGRVDIFFPLSDEGERIVVGVRGPMTPPLSNDDVKKLYRDPPFVAVVRMARMVDTESPDDVRKFANHLNSQPQWQKRKASDSVAREQLIDREASGHPRFMVTLVPELNRPSLQSAPISNPKLES